MIQKSVKAQSEYDTEAENDAAAQSRMPCAISRKAVCGIPEMFSDWGIYKAGQREE